MLNLKRLATLSTCIMLLLALTAGVAAGHSGGLDSNGGHHCREAGFNSGKCAPLNSYHCHSASCVPPGGSQPSGGGGGASQPAPAPPADTTPPDIPKVGRAVMDGGTASVPVTAERGARITVLLGGTVIHSATASGDEQVLVFSVPDGRHALEVVATDAAGNASTAAKVSVTVDTTPPDVPVLDIAAGRRGSPMSTVTISGEPGASYELVIAGAVSARETGRLPSSGEEVIELQLPNGDYEITTVLTDGAGNRSAETMRTLAVAVPAPSAPRLTRVSDPGAAPLVLTVSGDPGSEVVVTASGDAATAEERVTLDDDGTAEASFELPDGTYGLAATAEDFQGQTSSEVALSGLAVKTTAPTLALVFDEELLKKGRLAYVLESEPGARVRIDSDTEALRGEFVAGDSPHEIVVELAGGTYTLLVTAMDEFGNEFVQEFTADVVAEVGALAMLVALIVLFSPLVYWQRRRIAALTRPLRSRITPGTTNSEAS